MALLARFFTWWNGQTFGTQLWTWLYGELVGQDESRQPLLPNPRRQDRQDTEIRAALGGVQRLCRASTVPPSWHGWLHHTVDTPPTEETYQGRSWQKPHQPNLTPTAYRPSGSTLAQGRRPRATGDYRPWRPQ